MNAQNIHPETTKKTRHTIDTISAIHAAKHQRNLYIKKTPAYLKAGLKYVWNKIEVEPRLHLSQQARSDILNLRTAELFNRSIELSQLNDLKKDSSFKAQKNLVDCNLFDQSRITGWDPYQKPLALWAKGFNNYKKFTPLKKIGLSGSFAIATLAGLPSYFIYGYLGLLLSGWARKMAVQRSPHEKKLLGLIEWKSPGQIWRNYQKIENKYPDADICIPEELQIKNSTFGEAVAKVKDNSFTGLQYFRIHRTENPSWLAGYYNGSPKVQNYIYSEVGPLGCEALMRGICSLDTYMDLQQNHINNPEKLSAITLYLIHKKNENYTHDALMSELGDLNQMCASEVCALLPQNIEDFIISLEAAKQASILTGTNIKDERLYLSPKEMIALSKNTGAIQGFANIWLSFDQKSKNSIGTHTISEIIKRYNDLTTNTKTDYGWGHRLHVWLCEIPALHTLGQDDLYDLANRFDNDIEEITFYLDVKADYPESQIAHQDLLELCYSLSHYNQIRAAIEGIEDHGIDLQTAIDCAKKLYIDYKGNDIVEHSNMQHWREEASNLYNKATQRILKTYSHLPDEVNDGYDAQEDLASSIGFAKNHQKYKGFQSIICIREAFQKAVEDIEIDIILKAASENINDINNRETVKKIIHSQTSQNPYALNINGISKTVTQADIEKAIADTYQHSLHYMRAIKKQFHSNLITLKDESALSAPSMP